MQQISMDLQKVFLCSVLLLILGFDTLCFSRDIIPVNKPVKEGDLLVSKGKNFALGFFSLGSSRNRYLGIWFNKVSKQTVVWVANRENPITEPSGGVMVLNQRGNLVIYNGTDHDLKFPIWSTNVSADQVTNNYAAQLLDSGNLIVSLVDGGGREQTVWQSFDYPGNTVLPGMKVGLSRKINHHWTLNSWKSTDDPGIGYYWLKITLSGAAQLFLYNSTARYWRNEPLLMKKSDGVYNFSFHESEQEVYIIHYLLDESVIIWTVLDESGYIRALRWHESEAKWREIYEAPKFQCEYYGWCGSYAMCEAVSEISYECTCLPGYEPKSPSEWSQRDASNGCVRKRKDSSSICRNGEGFAEVERVKLPDSSEAVWISLNMLRDECEHECLSNCSCSAYASREVNGKNIGCLAWYGELKDILGLDSDGDNLYVRVDAQELAEISRKSNRASGSVAVLLVSIASAWIIVFVFLYLWCRKRKNRAKRRLLKHIGGSRSVKYTDTYAERSLDLEFFSLTKIRAATNNFSAMNTLGQGGFGTVYKGLLSDGREVAIKRLSKDSGQGVEEFKNKVMSISKLQHRNLVKLLGCCIHGKEKMLVYEYLPNKSLDFFLFDKEKKSLLNWKSRLDIIKGIARGVLYLHQDSRLRIIHRDLKTSNILLDSEMHPKISDFGLARMFRGDQLQDKTKRIIGSFGYMPPEYALFGKFSMKSDVFSFGVILLEIITGQKNCSLMEEDHPRTLIGHVWELWRENRAPEIVDSSMVESSNPKEATNCIQIGLLCVQEDPTDRPTMPQVLLMLDSDGPLPYPDHPAYILNRSRKNNELSMMTGEPCSVNEMTISDVLTR